MPVAAISANAQRWLRTVKAGHFEVLDLQTEESLSRLMIEAPAFAYVDRVVLNHDRSLVLFGISDGTGALLRVSDGNQLFRWAVPGLHRPPLLDYARAVGFSDDGRLAALGTGGYCLGPAQK